MKFDYTKEMPVGRRRNLNALDRAFLSLLMEKNFDDISVKDICDRAMVPKSTFYNYFEDKYDLLEHLFYAGRQMVTGAYGDWDMYDMQKALDLLSSFLAENRKEAKKILTHNPDGSTFQWALLQFTIKAFERIRIKFSSEKPSRYPAELQSKISSYKLICLCDWLCRNDIEDEEEIMKLIGDVFGND